MSTAGLVAATALACVAVVLAIARIRAQKRMAKSAKDLEGSRHRLNKSLAILSEVVNSGAIENDLLVAEIQRRSISKEEGHRYEERPFHPLCTYCNRGTHRARSITDFGSLALVDVHALAFVRGHAILPYNPARPATFRLSSSRSWNLEEDDSHNEWLVSSAYEPTFAETWWEGDAATHRGPPESPRA